MDFVLSDDQVDLQEELRRFLAARVTPEVRRAAMSLPGAVDRDLWTRVATMGVFALTVPEADGGVDLGMADAVVVFEELGRVAMPGPLIPTFLAAGVVDGAAWGDTVVGLVPAGAPAMVEHLDGLDALLVLDGADVRVASPLPAGAPVDRPLDPLTPVTVVDQLAGGPVDLDGDDVRRRGGMLAAAFQVGLGQAALDLATAYAAQREQFGRTIGSFQAVKHLLADAAVAVETARAGVHAAAVTHDEGGGDVDRLVHGARIVASAAAERSARACIQVHGGMGYTWELDAHLFLKRSLVLDQSFGGTAAAVDALAATL